MAHVVGHDMLDVFGYYLVECGLGRRSMRLIFRVSPSAVHGGDAITDMSCFHSCRLCPVYWRSVPFVGPSERRYRVDWFGAPR